MNKYNKWWQDSVIYQIYPRSFCDSNNDGVGDLQGIISKLDYLEKLGIEAIWLSPVCKSPQDDNGYDISDYKDIDPVFGNLADMEALIEKAKQHNIRILLDLVLNHSSDEHPWFIEAKKSKDNPYHDYYVWRDGTEQEPPNDMKAIWGGSAWEWVPSLGQYYFHQFAVKQPDLNWENPKLREEIYDMIRWWVQKGVGGFRLDVIDQIGKEPDLKITQNGPRLHEYIQELSKECFQNMDLLTVGEAWGADTKLAQLYSNPDESEFSMVFQFEHINLDQQEGKEKWDLAPLDFLKLKRVLSKWQVELYEKGWNSLFWDNHDLPRIVSRWGNDSPQYRELSAKNLAILLHGMQGTPYIYQGQELGMTNINLALDEYQDIESVNMSKARLEAGIPEPEILKSLYAKSRDNARTPMQWDDSANAGFTKGIPWMKVNDNYTFIHAKDQLEDPNSIFYTYQKLIRLRKTYSVFVTGKYSLLYPDDKQIFAYTRETEDEKILVVCNFEETETEISLPSEWKNSTVLISNYEDASEHVLRPYEAYILKR